jgi:hypothetical protein
LVVLKHLHGSKGSTAGEELMGELALVVGIWIVISSGILVDLLIVLLSVVCRDTQSASGGGQCNWASARRTPVGHFDDSVNDLLVCESGISGGCLDKTKGELEVDEERGERGESGVFIC